MNMPFKPAALARKKLSRGRPPFDCIALLLQGGGALGAYQAGVYEALAEAGLHPDWVAGISIGAINAALIAGNAPEDRVSKLRAFWETVSSNPARRLGFNPPTEFGGDVARQAAIRWSGTMAMLLGAPGLFAPRMLPPWLQPSGTARRNELLRYVGIETNARAARRLRPDQLRAKCGSASAP